MSLHVVATAGHVDHGKSSLIVRLTGIDPDRWEEEKRRGLTIDLGFAWTTLPSGQELGFVDVPGHERFIRNMLAGVGPVRLVLFVVAADEGWKPQSEEHLQILDVLRAEGAVVALTKRDLVDEETLALHEEEVRERLRGTRLEDAPIVACSSHTGDGIDDLRAALDEMVAKAGAPETTGRPRQFIDRVFTIRGSGTVVTGTLTGGPVAVGQEVQILPAGERGRIRGLQTHKRMLQTARPVSRVAVNLTGVERGDLERGDVLALPGQWRPTTRFEAVVRTVRGLDHPLTQRGAYKVYAGSAERDARIRFYDVTEVRQGDEAFARVTLSRPVVVDVGDAFVLREAGRRQTVGGGEVLDVDPPVRPGRDAEARLRSRVGVDRQALAWRVVEDRGAVRSGDVFVLSGATAEAAVARGAVAVGAWILSRTAFDAATAAVTELLAKEHAEHPLRPGLEVAEARGRLADASPHLGEPSLIDALLEHLVRGGAIVREGTLLRLPSHVVTTRGSEEADALVEAVRAAEPSPPTVKELIASGYALELIKATCAEGRLVRISPDIVITPELLAEGEKVARRLGSAPGLTVSAFREAMGTSRKYALPILEYFDAKGLTHRQGDRRVVRS